MKTLQTGFESQFWHFQVNPPLRASGLSSCKPKAIPSISYIGEITMQGEKSIWEDQSVVSVELALPGEVKELLREVVKDKKESDQFISERGLLAEAITHAKGKSCAELQIPTWRWKTIQPTSTWVPLCTSTEDTTMSRRSLPSWRF